MACGFAALGFFYARSVTRPVERLTVAARQMQAGDLEQTVLPSGSNELRQLTSAFNAMAASVASLDEQRCAFVANAAHELRTPLAALQALAYELQASLDSQKSTLAAFVRQTERLGRTVDSLLTLARLDNPDRVARMIPLRVRNLLLEVCWVMRPMVAQRSLELILAKLRNPSVSINSPTKEESVAIIFRQYAPNFLQMPVNVNKLPHYENKQKHSDYMHILPTS